MSKSKKTSEYSLIIQNPLVVHDTEYARRHIHCRSPEALFELCKDMVDAAQEMVVMFSINARNYIIDRHLVTLGLHDSSLIHPREVFRHAIADSAWAILIIHNHPSGDPTPSAEDIRITKQLVEAGRVVAIPVLDHLIIGRRPDPLTKQFVSMRESGLVTFDVSKW